MEKKIVENLEKENPIELIKKSQPFRFGNYDKYYSFRYKERFQDARLNILNKEYFLNKECLDIGCNDGSLTLMLAIKYFPKKMIGIDLDFRLINKAVDNLQFFEKQQSKTKPKTPDLHKTEEIKKIYEKIKNLPQSFQINMGIPNNFLGQSFGNNSENTIMEQIPTNIEGKNQNIDEDNLKILNRFPHNINFRIENFIQEMKISETFDTICCFSTTKWIHLNWGDLGIKRLFKKVHDSLNSGGIFIVEPQEWRAYKKKKCMNEDFKKIYRTINLKPKDFPIFLEKELNFKLIEKILPNLNETYQTFKRPIYVFQK